MNSRNNSPLSAELEAELDKCKQGAFIHGTFRCDLGGCETPGCVTYHNTVIKYGGSLYCLDCYPRVMKCESADSLTIRDLFAVQLFGLVAQSKDTMYGVDPDYLAMIEESYRLAEDFIRTRSKYARQYREVKAE